LCWKVAGNRKDVKKDDDMAERNEENTIGSRFAGQVGVSCHDPNEDGGFGHAYIEHIYMVDQEDPGNVDLHIHSRYGDDELEAHVFLTPDEALSLAFLLQRAVGWVFDAGGDTPEIEREAARFSVPEKG